MNKWSNIYTYGLSSKESEYVETIFAAPCGYHLYEAEAFSDLLAFPAIGLFIRPFSMRADDFAVLMDFYQTAHADDRSLVIVFMDAVEIPPSLAGMPIFIYEDSDEWIARVRDGLVSCAAIRARERSDAQMTMGDYEEEE